MQSERVIYYQDELSEDYSGNTIENKKITKSFKYLRDKNPLWRFLAFILYYGLAKPVTFIFLHITFPGVRQKNKKIAKSIKGAYFIYGNHTSAILDSMDPNHVRFKKNYIICNSDATSIPCVQNLVMMFGGIPLPSDNESRNNFFECVSTRIKQKGSITIYPEAHIWPYYTKVRDFSRASFLYPVMFNVPVIVQSTCYSKHTGLLKWMKKPKATVYIDGPFYPNKDLPRSQAVKELRDKVYNTMVERTNKYSTYEYIKYVKKDNEQ